MGQRFDSLDALAEAAAIARELKLPRERLDALRDEAIACLALPDLKRTGRVIPLPQNIVTYAFDSTMTRYALRFRDGTISVRRVADDQEVARFQARGDRDVHCLRLQPRRPLPRDHQPPLGVLTVWDIERHAIALNSPVRFMRLGSARTANESPCNRRWQTLGLRPGDRSGHKLVLGQTCAGGIAGFPPRRRPDRGSL